MKKQLEMEAQRPVKLHNVKFYNLAPRAIQCLAFNRSILKVALSRSDTTIEIWDLRTAPYMERTIVGSKKGSIEAICWVGNELLTAGLTGQISHWDLTRLSVRNSLMVTGSSIWCMDSFDTTIAVGTEEGYLNICELDVEMESLRYVKILDKQDGRILCCKFDKTGNHLVTGSVDVLRVWDVNSGHVIHKLTTGRSEKKKETVIWSILVLDDLQIASADSRGRLTIWDGKVGAQLESHQCLKADALCLATDDAEQRIFVSGIEPTVCSYNITTIKRDSHEVKRWVKTSSYYSHTHDVKALVVHGNNLISGGMDGYLCFTTYANKFYLQYGPLLQKPSATLTDNRMILLKYQNYLELWRLGSTGKSSELVERQMNGGGGGGDGEDSEAKNRLSLSESPVKLIELLSRSQEPLVCASISANGKWMTYSTAAHIRLFMLQIPRGEHEKPELHAIKPHIPDHYSSAAVSLFSPDSKQLFLYKTTGEVTVFELFDENQEIDFKQNISLKKYTSDLVHLMEISKCGKYLVLASLCNNVVIFVRGEEKVGRRTLVKWRHHMTLPQYNYPASTLTVHPRDTHRLVVYYTNNKMIEYDMEELEFLFSAVISDSDRGLGYHVTQSVVCDPAKTDSWLVQNEKEVLAVTRVERGPSENGSGAEESADEDVDSAGILLKRHKREERGEVSGRSRTYETRVVKVANHLVHLSWLGDDELVSVEISSKSLLDKLPPTLKQKKYGTG